DEPGASAARLDKLPMDFGEWHGTETPINLTVAAIGQFANAKQRTYVNPRTHVEFNTMVVCGRPGPISVHTPEVCFPGAGYTMVGEPVTINFPLGEGLPDGEFKFARFRKQGANGGEMEAFWAWTTDGHWQAPDYPRWVFGRFPALYKAYITRGAPAENQSTEEGLKAARSFLVELTNCIKNDS